MYDSQALLMKALSGCAQRMEQDLQYLNPSLLNESVFRHHLVRALTDLRPDALIQTEWKRIDLVIQADGITHLVEIKYYGDHKAEHLDGSGSWMKGGPGKKNFSEFVTCLNKLENLEEQQGMQQLSSLQAVKKWLVLAYSNRFAKWYDSIDQVAPETAKTYWIGNGPGIAAVNGMRMQTKLISVC